MRAHDDLGLFLDELVTLCQKYGFSLTIAITEIENTEKYEVAGFMSSDEDKRVLLPVYRVRGNEDAKKI